MRIRRILIIVALLSGFVVSITPEQSVQAIMLQGFPIRVTNVPSPDSGIDGETEITFTVTVRNLSTVTIVANLTANDPVGGLPIEFEVNGAGGPVTPFTLDPGDIAIGTYTLSSVVGPSPYTSTVTVTDGGTIIEVATAEVIVVSPLLVTNAADRITAEVGEIVTYTVIARNVGSTDRTGFSADDPGNPGTPINFSVEGAAATTPFDLASGETAIGTYTETVAGAGTFSSTVTVTNVPPGTLTEAATADVTIVGASAGISITKTANPTSGAVNDDITYTFTVTNTGAEDIVGMVVDDPTLGGNITSEFDRDVATNPLGPGNSTVATIIRPIDVADGNPVLNLVMVTADTQSGGMVSDSANAAVTVTYPGNIQVTVLADDYTPDVGQRVNYTAIVTNTGGNTLTSVAADATLPDDSTTGLSLGMNTLLPGQSTTGLFDYVIQANDGPTMITIVDAEGMDGTTLRIGTGSATVSISPTSGAIFSDLRAISCSVPCTFVPGDTVQLQATVVNIGTSTLTNVFLTSPQFGSINISPLTLLAGQNYSVVFDYIVPLGVTGGISFDLQATGEDVSGNTVEHNFTLNLGTVTTASISLILTADQEVVPLGGEITYTATITNTGDEPLNTLALTLSDNGSWFETIDLSSYLSTLYPAEEFVMTYVYSVCGLTPDPLVNIGLVTAVASGVDGRVVSDTDVVTINILRSNLLVSVVSDRLSAIVGESINYFVTIYNIGDGSLSNLSGYYQEAGSLVIPPTATPDPPTGYNGASGGLLSPWQQSGGVTITTTDLAQGQATTGEFSITTSSGTTNPLTLLVTVGGDGLSGVIPMTVVGDDTITVSLIQTYDTTSGGAVIVGTPIPGTADPEVSKIADQPFGLPNSIVIWTLTVRNPGEDPLTGLSISDSIPPALILETATTNNGTLSIHEALGTTILVEDISLNFNESAAITIITRVSDQVLANDVVTNTGCVQFGETSPALCADAQIRIAPDAGLLPTTGIFGPDSGTAIRGLLTGAGILLALMLLGGLLGMALSDDDDPDPEESGGGMSRLLGIAVVVVAAVIIVGVMAALVIGLGNSASESDEAALQEDDVTSEVAEIGEGATEEAPGDEGTATPEITETAPVPNTPTPLPPPATVPATEEAVADAELPFQPRYDRELFIPRLSSEGSMPIVDIELRNQTWDVRELGHNVGFLEGTTWVDDADAEDIGGNTVLAAHVQITDGVPGPFQHLDQLQVGDSVFLTDISTIYEYEVYDVNIVAPDDVGVTYPTGEQTLTLITCTGFDVFSNTFAERLVLRARPVRSLAYNR